MKNKILVIFLLSILSIYQLYGYNLRQINNFENLSNNSISSIFQSKNGLMWFGTCNGLNTYDGKNVEVFGNKEKSQVILSGSIIDKILETDPNTLWVQTYYGLDRIDLKRMKLIHYEMLNPQLLTDTDSNNNLFVIQSNNEIYYYSNVKCIFEKIKLEGIQFDEILSMYIDIKDKMWIINKDGTIDTYKIYSDKTGGNISISKKKGLKHRYSIQQCFQQDNGCYFIDSNSDLLSLSSSENSIRYIYNLKNELYEHGRVSTIIKSNNDYFIGFNTDGISILKQKKDKYYIERLPLNCGIFCLSKDRYQDIIWIGTDGQGVYTYVNNTYTVRSISFENSFLNMNRPIRALFLDDNTLWIGSKGDGIRLIHNYDIYSNLSNSKIDTYTSKNSSLTDNSVYKFFKSTTHNGIWIGTESGLNYYSKKTKSIIQIRIKDEHRDVRDIHDIYEQDSILWLATGFGIIKADISWNVDIPKVNSTQHIRLNDNDVSSNYFFSLFVNSTDDIWFANRGKGIYTVEPQTFNFDTIEFISKLENRSLNEIYSIAKVNQNEYLIGTSFGLVEMDRKNNSYKRKDAIDFPNTIIHQILKDSDSTFWLSTDQGLINYNYEKQSFRKLDKLNGLNVNKFSDGASFKDNNSGLLLFGGVNGFVAIHKEKNYRPEYKPKISFDHLAILGKEYNINDFLTNNENDSISTLTLSFDQNYFSLSCIALDYIDGNDYNYQYNLTDSKDKWIENGSSGKLYFTDMNPGEYLLSVKYHNQILGKDSQISQIRIRITPPLYQSTWAYIIYYSIGTFILFIIGYILTIRAKTRKEKLIKNIQEKHKEEIYESKLRFFTNIAHEFFTPLTLIYGPCNRILSLENLDKQVTKYTHIIQQNAERLNSLIQDLIEFRKIEKGYKEPQIENLELVSIVNDVIKIFQDKLDTKSIILTTELPSFINWNTDKKFFITTITNLISNGLNLIQTSGSINIRVITQDETIHLFISITGDSIKFKQEELKNIFDRYSILENFEHNNSSELSRNSIGLVISNNMVRLLKGEIKIKCVPDKEVTYELKLPQLSEKSIYTQQITNLNDIVNIYEPNIIKSLPKFTFKESLPTMLIIDDELDMLWLISNIFIDSFNIVTRNNIDNFDMTFEEIHPNIIIYDAIMPNLSGISFTRKLKTNPKTAHVPLILISSQHDVEEQIETIKAGAELYVTKPFNTEYLKTTVEQLINRKKTLKDYFESPMSSFDYLFGKLTHQDHKKFMSEIIEIINSNITNTKLSVSLIAEELNLSTRNIYRKLKIIGDISISDLIRDTRIHIAQNLLIKTTLTIDEIVYKAGFSNRVSFFKSFSKKNGCTPKEYRMKNQIYSNKK